MTGGRRMLLNESDQIKVGVEFIQIIFIYYFSVFY